MGNWATEKNGKYRFYDNLPLNQRLFLTSVSQLRDKRKGVTKTISSHTFRIAKDYRTMTSGWSGAPYFWRHGREPVFKTGDLVKE